MDNNACIDSDILARTDAKQIALESNLSGAALSSYPPHYASTVQQQQEAASTLKDFNNNDIVAWLKLARSACYIEPIPEHRPGERHLSPPQVFALSTLKDCPVDRLLSWLELARLGSHTPSSHASQTNLDPGPGPGPVLPFTDAQLKRSAAEVTLGTHATATGPPYLIPHPLAIDDFPVHNFSKSFNSTRSNKADNHYWCTVCEEPNSYKDSGNWKKHEKEHETIFVCGLDDAAESSRAGQSHASKPFTCKRRDIMVNHLNRSHGILDTQRGRDLADQWRHTMKKQAWSCGFCIGLFSTFQDRLKHIDTLHFKRHQSIHEWDLNKVIIGLLQQPKMDKTWKTRTASLPHWVHPEDLAWDRAIAKDLRTTLEIGPSDDHHAKTLADAAYSASKPNGGSWPHSGTTNANRHSNATAQASFLSSLSPYQATSALLSDPGLHHQPSPAITAHLVSGNPSFSRSPTNNLALGNTMEPAMPSVDDNGNMEHNALLFSPSQSWVSASESSTLLNGFGSSQSYDGRGANLSTPNWYGD